MAMGQAELPEDDQDRWRWIRNPPPPASEGIDFKNIRRTLKVSDEVVVVAGDSWNKLRNPDKDRIHRLAQFGLHHNPFIRHIVRRTRDYLETTIDPETNEPYLKPVKVKLYGETAQDSISLPLYLRDAYAIAEEFCDLLGQRMKGSGFLRTLLLRRVGSTICAGMNTAKSMLGAWEDIEEDDEDAVADDKPKSLTSSERDKLEQFLDKLEANQEDDPKYEVVRRLLIEEGWLEEGCIIFSQYFDSIRWLADQLSRDLSQGEAIGIYAGGQKSGVLVDGVFTRQERESLKQMVRRGEMRLLLGTDAASEGLNLQRLGTLINLDQLYHSALLPSRAELAHSYRGKSIAFFLTYFDDGCTQGFSLDRSNIPKLSDTS